MKKIRRIDSDDRVSLSRPAANGQSLAASLISSVTEETLRRVVIGLVMTVPSIRRTFMKLIFAGLLLGMVMTLLVLYGMARLLAIL